MPALSFKNYVSASALLLLIGSTAIAVTRYTRFTLLDAEWAIPPALVLGVLARWAARAARRRTERTIGRIGGEGVTRLGRILGGLGV